MNNQDLRTELDKLERVQKEIDTELKLGVDAYAEEMKNYLGETIKQELKNPTNKPISLKKSFWIKVKDWWNDLKARLYNYFFN